MIVCTKPATGLCPEPEERNTILTPSKLILSYFSTIFQFLLICPKKYVNFSLFVVKLCYKVFLQKNLQS